ncbi:MAG: 50S ribosomal protein L1 [Erysipelotrichaceae bacterium]|nr:50S ribosomal protein L1 [Erysipelotrichaceae bacterium]
MKKSKRHIANLEQIDKNKAYSIEDAIALAKKTSNAKFDATLEVAMNLNLDVKKADQQLRGAVVLPYGTGKSKTILVLAKGEQATAAKNAGADYVGDVDMIAKIEHENWFDYDVIIATPEMMPMLGKIGKLLGPKGLMPNPKTGTVTTDVVRAIEETKKGKVNYRTDSFGNVHGIFGKASFEDEKLVANLKAFIEVILKAKPTTAKGNYVKNISISSTMGPGIKIDLNSFDK